MRNRRRSSRAGAVAVAAVLLAAASADAAQHEGRILVRLRHNWDAGVWASWAMGGTVRHSSTAVPDLHVVDLPPGVAVADALAACKKDPGVRYAEPDYVLEALAVPNDPRFGDLWGLSNIGQTGGTADADIDAPEAWDITTGSASVVVAVIDTGIDYTHPDLVPNMFRNEVECDDDGVDDDGNGVADDCHGIDPVNDDGDPDDDNRHGTHVAGTIGAAGNDGVGVVGVNWNVRLMACKFLNEDGVGFTADAIRCLDYVKAMRDGGVNVVATNNSWGGGAYSQALADAIDAQRESGTLFIAAAGNSALDADARPHLPGGYFLPNVVAVAATTDADELAEFSTFGRRSVHLGAPGEDILSSVPDGAYGSFRGTSMATPHVAGVAALLAADDPSRDWRAIRNLLLAGGDPIAALDGVTVTGHRLNAHGALTCAGRVVRARLQPRRDQLITAVGAPLQLAALHIQCDAPNGELTVSVSTSEVLTLRDDGAGPDAAAADGIYSSAWVPANEGTYTLVFPDGDVVTVEATDDAMTNPEPAPGEWFGWAVAALGDHVLVGAPFDNTGAGATGTVYRVDPVTRTVEQTYVSPTPAPLERFGWRVATDGTRVLVGAPWSDAGALNTGIAHLFDASSGALLHTFVNPAGGENDFFGAAVAFGPGTIIIGAPSSFPTLPPIAGFGAAYVFDAVTMAHVATLHVDSPSISDVDYFGMSVAVVGNRIAVGAPPWIYFFDGDLGSPTFGEHVGTIHGAGFGAGQTLAVVGPLLASGDPFFPNFPDGGLAGGVAVYDPNTLERVTLIKNPIPTRLAWFGLSLTTFGTDLVVGAPEILHEVPNTFGPGRVFIVDPLLGAMKRVFVSPATSIGDGLGTSVAVVGDRIIAGAPFNDLAGFDSGALLSFDPALPPAPSVSFASRCYKATAWNPVSQLFPPQIGLSDVFETASVKASKPATSFCTAASISGSIVSRTDIHHACFKARNAPGQPKLVPFTIDVDNMFGQSLLKVKKGTELCLVARFEDGIIPEELDDMRCYAVSPASGGPKFIRREVDLGDRFTGARTMLLKPYRYCVPTRFFPRTLNPGSPEVTCYKAKDLTINPPLSPLGLIVQTRFIPAAPLPRKISTFCVVSNRIPPPPPPPWALGGHAPARRRWCMRSIA